MPTVFPLQLRFERLFGMSEELRLSLAIVFCLLDQSRSTAPE
ncbi:MAG TPA: hypothetical protein VGK90_07425 [Rhizomicrobium sp.]|jgi:hypothetical protein